MDNKLWWLYNSKKNVQLPDLDLQKAKDTLTHVASGDLKYWFVWQEGWGEWIPVEKWVLFAPPKVKATPPPLPQIHENPPPASHAGAQEPVRAPLVYESEATTVTIAFEDTKIQARRHLRLSKRLRADVECRGQIFTTHTVDVSSGGASFEDPLPSFLQGKCQLRLFNVTETEYVDVEVKVIESRWADTRVRVEFCFAGESQPLTDWLKVA